MSYGLWVVGYGLWVMGYGLWVVGCGLIGVSWELSESGFAGLKDLQDKRVCGESSGGSNGLVIESRILTNFRRCERLWKNEEEYSYGRL